MNKRGFASDNNSGVHPNIIEAISKANQGHVIGYGDDIYSHQAIERFRSYFGSKTEVFFVFNGTGANVLAISTLLQSFHSVICASTAHIMVDECGAPEKFSGSKLIPIDTPDGKLRPESIIPHLHGFGFEHHAQPGMISISQVSEMGTLYTVNEIKQLADLAHQHKMYLHMDGARIANAAVALGLPFVEFTKNAGVDILSFGGTKNGMMMGEAVLIFNNELAKNTKYIRKQSAQLFSKMRFVSAQFIAYFENDLWKQNAQHANKMAQILAQKVSAMGVPITQKVQANGVFAIIDDRVRDKLQKEYFFYAWDENKHEVRWMTAFDTTLEDVDGFCQTLEKLLNE